MSVRHKCLHKTTAWYVHTVCL